MYERPVKRRDREVYRDCEFHVILSEDEWRMLDRCSDELMVTKSELVRNFINELYIECILRDD